MSISTEPSNDETGVCEGCQQTLPAESLTDCRIDYPDETHEYWKFCSACLAADMKARGDILTPEVINYPKEEST